MSLFSFADGTRPRGGVNHLMLQRKMNGCAGRAPSYDGAGPL